MKRYVYARTNEDFLLNLTKVLSITLVDNAFEFSPRDHMDSISISSAKRIRKDYFSMTRKELLGLSPKELASIKDVNVLRKLSRDELTQAQQVLVGQANSAYSDIATKSKVIKVLEKLKECKSFFIWPTPKNRSFISEITDLGGQVENSDLRKIVHSLSVENFTEFTLSYLDINWNSLLLVAEYKGDYTFKAIDEDGQDVTVKDLDLYIKLDIDNKSGQSIGAMSFHHPEFKMSHPYAKRR